MPLTGGGTRSLRAVWSSGRDIIKSEMPIKRPHGELQLTERPHKVGGPGATWNLHKPVLLTEKFPFILSGSAYRAPRRAGPLPGAGLDE